MGHVQRNRGSGSRQRGYGVIVAPDAKYRRRQKGYGWREVMGAGIRNYGPRFLCSVARRVCTTGGGSDRSSRRRRRRRQQTGRGPKWDKFKRAMKKALVPLGVLASVGGAVAAHKVGYNQAMTEALRRPNYLKQLY